MAMLSWFLMLIPGGFVWMRGKKILPRKDEAIFALLNFQKAQHTGLAIGLTFGMVLVFGNGFLILQFALMMLAVNFAEYPYRKALHGFSQGPVAYVVSVWRLMAALHGQLIGLALIPAVAALAEELAGRFGTQGWALPAGFGMATLSLLAMHFTPWRFRLLVGSKPIEQPHLDPHFSEVLQQARGHLLESRLPEIRHFGPKDGFFLNAFALTSFYRPLVVLSDDLLKNLGPSEVGGIFAHEMAHLEEVTPWRRAVGELYFVGLVALALVPVVLLTQYSPSHLIYAAWIWPLLFLLGRNLLSSKSQDGEFRSDRRAVEMTGDGPSLMFALQKIHWFNVLPRRWPAEQDNLSHPSLAKRLRAIRETMAASRRPSEPPSPPPTDGTDIVVRGVAERGTMVILCPGHIHWLSGVSLEAGADPRAAYEVAQSKRSLTYQEVLDLRLALVSGGKTALVASFDDGKRNLVLADADLGRVKQRLDQIDHLLQGTARLHGPVASETSGNSITLRINGFLLGIMGVFNPLGSSLMAAGLALLIAPSRTALALAGVLTIVSRLAAVAQGEPFLPFDDGLNTSTFLVITFLLLGILFLGQALRRLQQRMQEPTWTLVLPFALTAPVMLISAVFGGLRWTMPSPRWHFFLWVREFPHLIALLIAWAAALWFLRRRGSWIGAAACLAAGCLLAALGSPWARVHFVEDPLAAQGPELAIGADTTPLDPLRTMEFEGWASGVRWSTSGQRLAILGDAMVTGDWQGEAYGEDYYGYGQDYDEGRDDPAPEEPQQPSEEAVLDSLAAEQLTANVYSVELAEGHWMTVIADDLVFIDDEHLLLLEYDATETRLHTLSLLPSIEDEIQLTLPPLFFPTLEWLDGAQQWQLTGDSDVVDSESAGSGARVRYRGSLTGGFERVMAVPSQDESMAILTWVPSTEGALLVSQDINYENLGKSFLMSAFAGFEGVTQLNWVNGGEKRHLASTALRCDCLEPPPGRSRILCLVSDNRSTMVWSVDPDGGALSVRGHVDVAVTESAYLESGLLLRLDDSEFVLLDPETWQGHRLQIDSNAQNSDAQGGGDAAGGDFLSRFLEDSLSGWWTSSSMSADVRLVSLTTVAEEGTTVELFEVSLPASQP